MSLTPFSKTLAIATAIGVSALLLLWAPLQGVATAGNGAGENGAPHPANKIAVAGTGLKTFHAPGSGVAIFTESIKTSTPTDLIFSVDLECSILTAVAVTGNGESEAQATVKVWVELDGKVVKVAPDDTMEEGKVTFCDRTYQMEVTDLEDEDARFRHHIETMSTHGFSWVAMNVGNQVHSIVVKADLTTSTSGQEATAEAGIFKRILIVEPVKLANDETLEF